MSQERTLQENVERRLADAEPGVEVIVLERSGPEALRLFIDHPDGVDLELCERVTGHLSELLSEWSLEVSSPGLDRPLAKPEHFSRFVGRRVRVRTREPLDGRRTFTGTLTGADSEGVSITAEGTEVEIAHARIQRSNLAPTEAEASP